jgi:hypothetical protein
MLARGGSDGLFLQGQEVDVHMTGLPFEKRMEILENDVKQLTQRVRGVERELDREARDRQAADDAQRAVREQAEEKLRRLIEEASVGGLHLETAGLVWLMSGVLLTTFSGDFVTLLSRC